MPDLRPPLRRLSLLASFETPYSPMDQRLRLALLAALTVWLYEIGTYAFVWLVGGYHFMAVTAWVTGRLFVIPFLFAFFLMARTLRYHRGYLLSFIGKHIALAVVYILLVRTVLVALNYFAPSPDDTRERHASLWLHLRTLDSWPTWGSSLNEQLAGYLLGLMVMFAADMLVLYNAMQSMTEELREANLRLEEASQTDPLTGARNRRYLAEQLPRDIALFHRQMDEPDGYERSIVFLLMDLDHFKKVNDTWGHNAGDRLLVEFAGVLKGMIRQGDYLVRWGGEEFLLVMRSVRHKDVGEFAERIRQAVQDHAFHAPDGRELHITCSLGAAEYPFLRGEPDAVGWETVVMLADRATYSIKQSGRNGSAVVQGASGASAAALGQNLERGQDWLLQQKLIEVSVYRDGRPAS